MPRVPDAVPRAAAEPALQRHPQQNTRGRNVSQKEPETPGGMSSMSGTNEN